MAAAVLIEPGDLIAIVVWRRLRIVALTRLRADGAVERGGEQGTGTG